MTRSRALLLGGLTSGIAVVALVIGWLGDRTGKTGWGHLKPSPEAIASGPEMEESLAAPHAESESGRLVAEAAKDSPAQSSPSSRVSEGASDAHEESPREPDQAPRWKFRYRVVDPLGRTLSLQDFKRIGIGPGTLSLGYSAADGTSRVVARVPETNDGLRLEERLLDGRGVLPARLVLTHGGRELARGVVTKTDQLSLLEVDTAELESECYEVRFQVESGAVLGVDLRGLDRLTSYVPETMPTAARLDGRPGDPGETGLVVGLPPGEYGYEAKVYELRSNSIRLARGHFTVSDSDQMVSVSTVDPGSIEGAIGPTTETGYFIQLLSIEALCISCMRPVRVEGDSYQLDGLAPGSYRLVAYKIDRATLAVSFLHEAPVEIFSAKVTKLDLWLPESRRGLREWTFHSESEGFTLTVTDLLPDGQRRTFLDVTENVAGLRLSLPREMQLEFRASPIVDTSEARGPDFGASVVGVPNERGEVWFDFRQENGK